MPASANNVAHWVDEAVRTAQNVAGQSDASDALAEAKKVQVLLDHVVNGLDENEDGTVSWQEGEGGIAQAAQHMGFMVKGEGLS